MRRLKVLAVDDHRLMLDAIRAVLGREDDILLVAETDAGDKVVPLVGQTGPDVVLLDVRMPGMSGQELYRLITERDEALARRTVFVTGDTFGADTLDFLSATGNPSLNKPLDVEELRRQILRIREATHGPA